ncbi:MAG: ATP-binding protein [Flavobacteriaceae bacterium]|nr:ATP-binding protein [Flavobacteriaceae bacterium]
MSKLKVKGISLRFRIFIFMILMVILSSILIAVVTVVQYNLQSQEYHNQRLERKENQLILSINYVIENSISSDDIFSNINDDKINEISNIQNIEFRIFDLKGNLIKSSDIKSDFNGVDNYKISEDIINKFQNDNINRYIENNSNNKNYKIAYNLLKDVKDNPIGILYVPYYEFDFVNYNELKSFSLKIGLVYFNIIIIATFFAYFLSRYITKPLFQISNKLKELNLTKSKDKIILNKPPKELAILVDSYNLMIDQLENSAQKLAQSERENAWREMAKQVAHEIKNPLTPMRLSIQSFQRNFELNSDDVEKKIDEFSNTLIQQIDVMSSIANAFSDFAKMPEQNKEFLNLNEVIYSALDIFDSNFISFTSESDTISANLDKDQLIRVITNLVKNAIQSIPDDRTPVIDIYLSENSNNVIIKISDNGSGISEDIKHKVFEPKFTTKSSGMGLGLSIISNIVKSFNGTIEFESKKDIGTTFSLTFPKN